MSDHKGMIWNGHPLVCSGHPADDEPWCKACGIPASHPDAAARPCPNADRTLIRHVRELDEIDDGWGRTCDSYNFWDDAGRGRGPGR